MITRIPVMSVEPQIEGGLYPVKAVPHEPFTVRASVFGEGRGIIRAEVILCDPDGVDRPPVAMRHLGDDQWEATVSADSVGAWTFRIASWHDPIAAWLRDAPIKLTAGIDVQVTLAEGAALLRRAKGHDRERLAVADVLGDRSGDPAARYMVAQQFMPSLGDHALREHLGESDDFPVFVDRERALVGAWYTMFPRSEGAVEGSDHRVEPGTLRTAAHRLEAIAAMGFDVVHLPPIHPIGEVRRKGRNGAASAEPGDPGSPWAVGSQHGGHDSVHPELGTLRDFEEFVQRAGELGLEVALDLALQCSPDHPWVKEHPNWFTHRADGSIAPAERPPSIDRDVYPLNFDSDPDGIHAEVLRILRFWIRLGVRIFRVDAPHLKPVGVWERILSDVRDTHPDVIFLAGAMTSPAMQQGLAQIGFHQSYTPFARREHAAEMADHLDEVSSRTSSLLRPHFFVNTPELLPTYLNSGDEAMFKARIVLAAMGSPTWGMYAGYELLEHTPAESGGEEYLDSEKYEIKVRHWERAPLAPYITRINQIRHAHPALQQLRNLRIHPASEAGIVAFSKISGDDVVLVVVDLYPSFRKTTAVHVDPRTLGLREGYTLQLFDEIDGHICRLDDIPLSPATPARILIPFLR